MTEEQYPINGTLKFIVTPQGPRLVEVMPTIRAEDTKTFWKLLHDWVKDVPWDILAQETAEAAAEMPAPEVPPAQPPQAAAAAAGPPTPTCGVEGCGLEMAWRSGVTNNRAWKGWFCPTGPSAKHPPIYVN